MKALLIESVAEMSHDKEIVVYIPSKTFFGVIKLHAFIFAKKKQIVH